MKNIVLIGMPGAGKSTVGTLLAHALEIKYIDTDNLIKQKEGTNLNEIIREKGLDYFLELESSTVFELNEHNAVIATGGSVVYNLFAMKRLKQSGVLIFLNLSLDNISKRIGNIETRGVAIHENQSLEDLYKERIPLYLRYADIIIECNNKTAKDIAVEISEKIGFYI